MFSLGYTKGISKLIEDLNVASQISDVYYSLDRPDLFISTARVVDDTNTLDEMQILQNMGIKSHLVINGSTYPAEFYTQENFEKVIQYITSSNVDIVTINNTLLLKYNIVDTLAKSGVIVKNSVNNMVRSLKDVITFNEFFGVTNVMLDGSLNRNFDELESIVEYCKSNEISTTLLLNEGCIADCPFKKLCDNAISDGDEKYNDVIKVYDV